MVNRLKTCLIINRQQNICQESKFSEKNRQKIRYLGYLEQLFHVFFSGTLALTYASTSITYWVPVIVITALYVHIYKVAHKMKAKKNAKKREVLEKAEPAVSSNRLKPFARNRSPSSPNVIVHAEMTCDAGRNLNDCEQNMVAEIRRGSLRPSTPGDETHLRCPTKMSRIAVSDELFIRHKPNGQDSGIDVDVGNDSSENKK